MLLRGGTTKQSHGSIVALYSMRLPRYARNDMFDILPLAHPIGTECCLWQYWLTAKPSIHQTP
jgi:hypothetical protein